MYQNNDRVQAGRGPLPRTFAGLIVACALLSNANAQDPDALFSASMRVRVDPQQLNLDSIPGINARSAVFLDPISFTVNLWTDNTLTMSGDVVTMHMDFSQEEVRSISRGENFAVNVGYKGTVPGTEVTGGQTSGSGVTTVHSGTMQTGWAVADEIRFKLEGNKISVVVTSTVAGITRTTEIELGTLNPRELFKPFAENEHLKGKDWWLAPSLVRLPGNIADEAPVSANPLLDYSSLGKRGFIDHTSLSRNEPGWVVVGYILWRVYSGDQLLFYWVETEYVPGSYVISPVILRKPQFTGSVVE